MTYSSLDSGGADFVDVPPQVIYVGAQQVLAPPVVVPDNAIPLSAATVKHLNDALVTHDGQIATRGRAVTVNVADKGTVGTSNDTAAFTAALAAARDSAASIGGSDPVGHVCVELPAGVFTVTQAGALLGTEGASQRTAGLRIKGQGPGVTTVVFSPSAAASLMTNNYWQNVTVEGVMFQFTTPGCTLFDSRTTQAAQRFTFRDVVLNGAKYWAHLEGDNNNSEIRWDNCETNFMSADGAWLHIPDANASDQFLNYWWSGCKHWSTSAPWIDAAKGGSFHLWACDASDWAAAATGPVHLFKLHGFAHAEGVCSLRVDGLRVEPKNVNAKLLYSEWPQGVVSMQGIDWMSQVGNYTYGDIVEIVFQNTAGATYVFTESQLAGGVNVAYSFNDFLVQHSVTFDHCQWLQRNSPTDVVTYNGAAAFDNAWMTPPVEFRDCGPRHAPQYVWDATVGWKGSFRFTLPERRICTRGDVILPAGAEITGFGWCMRAGAVSESDGGELVFTNDTGTEIGRVTVTGARSAGFNLRTTLAAPWFCDTLANRTIHAAQVGVSEVSVQDGLFIYGNW